MKVDKLMTRPFKVPQEVSLKTTDVFENFKKEIYAGKRPPHVISLKTIIQFVRNRIAQANIGQEAVNTKNSLNSFQKNPQVLGVIRDLTQPEKFLTPHK